KLQELFAQKKWNATAFLNILEAYNSSPEMFMIRLLNIIPKNFGLGGMFFMRSDHKKRENETSLKKQLHLTRTRNPKKITLLEMHCQEWLNSEVFSNQTAKPQAHCHRFVTDGRNQSFMVLALSRPMKRNPNASLAVVIGFEETNAFKKKIAFTTDPSIAETVMQVDATELQKEDDFKNIRSAMKALIDSEKLSAIHLSQG
ncbi:MAG: hypothetical protein JKX84_00540, partial [Flavobacteriales bacterium]|nr:hypothetical protein [Flavobacteriales bacterium]